MPRKPQKMYETCPYYKTDNESLELFSKEMEMELNNHEITYIEELNDTMKKVANNKLKRYIKEKLSLRKR